MSKNKKLKTETSSATRYTSALYGDIIRENPVFVRALAISPVLAVTVSLRNGLLVSAVMLVELMLLYLLKALIYDKVPDQLLNPLFFVAAGVFITPLGMLSQHFVPNITTSLGIYLPLLAVNALAFLKTERPAESPKIIEAAPSAGSAEEQKKDVSLKRSAVCLMKKVGRSLFAAVGSGLGFALAVLVFSGLREAIGSGTLYDRVLPGLSKLQFSFILLPPGAFLLLGFLMAAVQAVKLYRENRRGTSKRSGEGDQE